MAADGEKEDGGYEDVATDGEGDSMDGDVSGSECEGGESESDAEADEAGDGDALERHDIDIRSIMADLSKRSERAALTSAQCQDVCEFVQDRLPHAYRLRGPIPMYHQLEAMCSMWADQRVMELTGRPSGILLADMMGLGKTVAVTGAIFADWRAGAGAASGAGRATVVFVPLSLIEQWVHQLEAHSRVRGDSSGRRMRVMSLGCANKGNLKRLRDALSTGSKDVIVASMELLKKGGVEYWRSLPVVRRVVIDEAHRISNGGNVTSVSAANMRAQCRLAVTGTPMPNRYGELYQIMAWLTTRDHAAHKARTVELARSKGTTNELLECCRVRRTSADINMHIVPIHYQHLRVRLPDAHAKINRLIKASKMSYLAKINLLRQLMLDYRFIYSPEMAKNKWVRANLRHIDPAPAGAAGAGAAGAGAGAATAESAESAVVQQLVDSVREVKRLGQKAIVYTHFKSEVHVLASAFERAEGDRIVYTLYTGEQEAEAKAGSLDDFRLHGDVLISNIVCGGCGLNMPFANHVYLLSVDFNPYMEMQAIGRVHRLNQKLDVVVVCVNIDDAELEDTVQRMQVEKIENAQSVMGADLRAQEHLARNEQGMALTSRMRALAMLDADARGPPQRAASSSAGRSRRSISSSTAAAQAAAAQAAPAAAAAATETPQSKGTHKRSRSRERSRLPPARRLVLESSSEDDGAAGAARGRAEDVVLPRKASRDQDQDQEPTPARARASTAAAAAAAAAAGGAGAGTPTKRRTSGGGGGNTTASVDAAATTPSRKAFVAAPRWVAAAK
jgi:superfamily II DNA or RNA helicase